MTDSAIWLTCRDCGHTTRVLALLARRMLKARTCCQECSSPSMPRLNRTPIGTGIVLTEEQNAALRGMDDPALHAWLNQAEKQSPLEWIRVGQSRLVNGFSRGERTSNIFGLAPQSSRTGRVAARGTNVFHGATGTINRAGSATVRL